MDPRDRVGFAELYADHRSELSRFFARRVSSTDAEELVAQTVAEAWAGRGGFDPDRGEPAAWLFGVAHNVLRRHWRTSSRRDRAYAAIAVPGAEVLDEMAVVRRVDARASAQHVSQAMGRLSPIDREVLTLRGAGRTNAEIAARLGLTPGTVKSRLSRARKRLESRVGVASTTQGRVR